MIKELLTSNQNNGPRMSVMKASEHGFSDGDHLVIDGHEYSGVQIRTMLRSACETTTVDWKARAASQMEYSIQLQRLIERFCAGDPLPYPDLHHHKLLAKLRGSSEETFCDCPPDCQGPDNTDKRCRAEDGLPGKASAQPWTRSGSPVGTHRMGYVYVSYSKVVEVFGEPEYHGDRGDSRVIFEWVITFADGTVATIYDYKQSKLYGDDPDAPTPDEMKTLPSFEWHIGGKDHRAVELVQSVLNGKGDGA